MHSISCCTLVIQMIFCYCFCPVAVVKNIYLFLKYYKDNLDQIWYIASVGKRIQIVNCITHPP